MLFKNILIQLTKSLPCLTHFSWFFSVLNVVDDSSRILWGSHPERPKNRLRHFTNRSLMTFCVLQELGKIDDIYYLHQVGRRTFPLQLWQGWLKINKAFPWAN